MKATLKEYSNQQQYEIDSPVRVEAKESIAVAVNEAKLKIKALRGTSEFIGFKIYDIHGDLRYKLPGY